MTQVTIKCDKRIFVFDWISRNTQCSDLLSMLEVRLAVKIPGNARLMENGRVIGMSKSIEEAGLIGSCILEVEFGISGGMRCFRCLRLDVESESEHQNSRMRAEEVRIPSMGQDQTRSPGFCDCANPRHARVNTVSPLRTK